MKAALFIVLSLAVLAAAGPASLNRNTNKNEFDTNKVQQHHQQQQYTSSSDLKQTPAVELLKQWCFSSQMSQPELTNSFKKLVGLVKSTPIDEATEAAVMSERICQGALVQKSSQSGETLANTNVDAQAHELIKDVYMDSLIACESRECMQQLLKLIQSQKVDTIRASYYMTRMAVAEKDSIKDERDVKQWAETLIKGINNQQYESTTSEAIERQKLFATTTIVGKYMKNKCDRREQIASDLKQTVEQVAETIIERYIRPVNTQEVQQYQQQYQQQQQQVNKELVKKIAKRNAALKALANLPGCVLAEIPEVEKVCVELAQNKQELVTVRQSAIECLKHNEKVYNQLKQITFEQDEPTEVRIAALRTLMTVVWVGKDQQESQKEQIATEIVEQLIKHCEEQRNQQQDDQFVLYAISYLDNLRTSQKPEHQAIRECISKNKQHYMQIQLLCKKFKQQLNDIRRSSRNYKLEQEFNQIESGLVLEGDIIYESKQKQHLSTGMLPKLVRVNMSMPIMGETVNVVEITLRQNQMDEELLSTLKLVKDAKFNSESVSKVVDSFKLSQQQQQQDQRNKKQYNNRQAEADLTIKVDGCTVVYICSEDFKYTTTEKSYYSQRNTRSVHGGYSIIEELLEQLKRNPINFNRGFNVNFNQRLAKALDVDANLIAGLRFNSRASGSLNDFEVVAQIEPRFSFEAIVGPAKITSKKLLQRVSTKTAFGLRYRFKNNELADIQIDLPMNTMELFTFETQMVEKDPSVLNYPYLYRRDSSLKQDMSDIYSPSEESYYSSEKEGLQYWGGIRSMQKRSIFEKKSTMERIMSGYKRNKFAFEVEVPEKVARMTGLRGKVRFVASPKDMRFFAQAICQKYEPTMQGYRFKIEKVNRGIEQQQVTVVISTPGSTYERTMQLRSIVQFNQQRTMIKADFQSPMLSSRMQFELVHDGRQYALKAECVDGLTNGNKWRHNFECGVQRNNQSGRLAATYKPYLTIQSSYLRRPIQMQGVISYQQQPKTVISWEMKCPTSGDFIQGKFIVDQKENMAYQNKRSSMYQRRSMRSPLEMIFERDYTLTGEVVAQLKEHLVKLHKMVEYDANMFSINADLTASHKNLKKSVESQFIGQVKLNNEQQLVLIQRKCPQYPHKEYRIQVVSDNKIPKQHQLVAEYRYNTRRLTGSSSDLSSIVAYKHKINLEQYDSQRVIAAYQIELLANEMKLDEKIQGRTDIFLQRRGIKVLNTEMSSRDKQCKLIVEFESLEKHHIELFVESKKHQISHKTTVRADQRQFQCQSRTDKRNQMLVKFFVELMKQSKDCQIVLEVPKKQVRLVADLKLTSGKPSSWAIQTPRFSSKAEFVFDIINNNNKYVPSFWRQPTFQSILPFQSLKFKTDLKDLINKDSYWMDTKYDRQSLDGEKSYFRIDSPFYRTDVEYDPRDLVSKIGMYAREKRSINNLDRLYSNEESVFDQDFDYSTLKSNPNKKLNLSNKLWMFRTMLNPTSSSSSSSSSSLDNLKDSIKRAIFEYADRRQQHKHQISYSPSDDRLNFNFEHLPTVFDKDTTSFENNYKRFGGDFRAKRMVNYFVPNYFKTLNKYQQEQDDQQVIPSSKLFLESSLIDMDVDYKPFDGETSYASLLAKSRLPRSSGFKKHESEYKYNKHHGYKASMKHMDKEDRHHKWQLEADKDPKKYTKMSYDSDKHGKVDYEHNWRKYVTKRSEDNERDINNKKNNEREEEEELIDFTKLTNNKDDQSTFVPYYKNRVSFFAESPRDSRNKQISHNTQFMWKEPVKMDQIRYRRDVDSEQLVSDIIRPYNTYEYLKHISARLNSQMRKGDNQLYKVDFDYQPQQHRLLSLNFNMPEDLIHSSSFEYQPEEKTYKLHSKLFNKRNAEAHYELVASTKPFVSGLATADQEPIFFNDQHPMLERQMFAPRYQNIQQTLSSIFRQPLKMDYTDKFGRVARFDYDYAPFENIVANNQDNKYFGLRQKRAALSYKDDMSDIDYQLSHDFYPEALINGGFKKDHMMKHNMISKFGEHATKISTKYGPIVIRVNSNPKNTECFIDSPIVNVKLTGESSSPMKRLSGVKLYKIQLDNKNQRVQLAKLVRKSPVLKEFEPIVRLAHKFDNSRFEHQSELLVSFVDAILKLKSTTFNNERPVMVVEGEFNKQQEKLIVKIDGERTTGKLVCDLVTGSSELVLNVDDKRTVQHQTRLVRLNEKFYSLESMTTYNQQPLFKLSGKISSEVFSNPMHLFETISRHQSHHYNMNNNNMSTSDDLISTFEATVYEPKMYHVRGQYDCLKKELKLVFKNEEDKKVQITNLKYDAPNMTVYVDARLSSQNYGQIYQWQSKIAIPGVYYPRHCRQQQSCQSEVVYTDKNGHYSASYLPGEYAMINTPFGKQYINLAY